MGGFSQYDRILSPEEVARGAHRDFVGGLWEELGRLQLSFLVEAGLTPDMRLLDIGCGCLRGGIHFVRYLGPEHYFGVDSNASLLEAGYEVELAAEGLLDRLPRANLLQDGEFRFDRLGTSFDMAIAQSLFTHLPLNHIRLCLARLAGCLKPQGRLFATYFGCPEEEPWERSRRHPPAGIETHPTLDPFHYRFSDLAWCADGRVWASQDHGDWDHPRGQRMAVFTRLGR